MACSMFATPGSRAQPRGKSKMGKAVLGVSMHRPDFDPEACKAAEVQATRHDPTRPHVFLDIGVEKEPVGRIVIELFSDIVPHTAKNFRHLCLGDKGFNSAGRPLHYKGSHFHRIVPNVMVQAGDNTKQDGSGGESIFGGYFEDENFSLSHSSAGLLSMATSRPNHNGSQFQILLKEDASLDKKSVVFGRVIHGMEIVKRIDKLGATDDCAMRNKGNKKTIQGHEAVGASFQIARIAWISDCGELPRDEKGFAGVGAVQEGNPAKRARTKGPSDGEPCNLYHLLKKHKDLKKNQTWGGKPATITKGKAKLICENARKRVMAAPTAPQAFVELAREHSDDYSASKGGELGAVESGSLAPDVEEVAFKLAKGELSQIFETDAGVHLLMRAA